MKSQIGRVEKSLTRVLKGVESDTLSSNLQCKFPVHFVTNQRLPVFILNRGKEDRSVAQQQETRNLSASATGKFLLFVQHQHAMAALFIS